MINDLQSYLNAEPIRFPQNVDLLGIMFFSLTGALAAMRRGYDFVGVFILALVVGAGGGLIRDGLFLQQGPPALTQDWRFIPTVVVACLFGWLINSWIVRFHKTIALIDAVGLSIYSLIGLIKAIEGGLSAPAAILVGLVNAVGGGLLRDVLTQDEPLLFKPGQFYVVASLAGCALFVAIGETALLSARPAAWLSAMTILVLRVLAIEFNWRTGPVKPWSIPSRVPSRRGKSNQAADTRKPENSEYNGRSTTIL